jgi:hypothetical protein
MPKEVIISAERIERVIGAMASGPVTYDDIKGRVEALKTWMNISILCWLVRLLLWRIISMSFPKQARTMLPNTISIETFIRILGQLFYNPT